MHSTPNFGGHIALHGGIPSKEAGGWVRPSKRRAKEVAAAEKAQKQAAKDAAKSPFPQPPFYPTHPQTVMPGAGGRTGTHFPTAGKTQCPGTAVAGGRTAAVGGGGLTATHPAAVPAYMQDGNDSSDYDDDDEDDGRSSFSAAGVPPRPNLTRPSAFATRPVAPLSRGQSAASMREPTRGRTAPGGDVFGSVPMPTTGAPSVGSLKHPSGTRIPTQPVGTRPMRVASMSSSSSRASSRVVGKTGPGGAVGMDALTGGLKSAALRERLAEARSGRK